MSSAIRRNAPRDKGAALYMELIARFPVRPLRSDRTLERAAKIANALAIRDDLTQGETDYLDVLTDMIEKYEDIHYPVQDVSGVELLRSSSVSKANRKPRWLGSLGSRRPRFQRSSAASEVSGGSTSRHSPGIFASRRQPF